MKIHIFFKTEESVEMDINNKVSPATVATTYRYGKSIWQKHKLPCLVNDKLVGITPEAATGNVLRKKVFLKICKFHRKRPVLRFFLIKLQASDLELY